MYVVQILRQVCECWLTYMKIRKDFVERGKNLTVSFVQNKARKYEMKRQQFFKLLLIFFYNKEKQMTHKIVPLVSWGEQKGNNHIQCK